MPQKIRTSVRRLVLRPGVHVLRRSATELQVGLDPRRAMVLPDEPRVRSALSTLGSPGATPPEDCDTGTVDLLAEAGLLVDVDVLLRLVASGTVPTANSPAVSRTDASAVAASDGEGATGLVAARGRELVEVVRCGPPEAAPVSRALTDLLTAAGVRCTAAARSAATRPRASTGVLVAVGEPARECVDDWMRAGTSHLVLRLTEGSAVIGPFVRPGKTACLRCVDAHHTDVDPAWPLLVAQHASAVVQPRDDTVPEPVDSLLAALAAAWAAREVVSHAEGRSPASMATTIRLDPRLTALETHSWPRHPACGCSGL